MSALFFVCLTMAKKNMASEAVGSFLGTMPVIASDSKLSDDARLRDGDERCCGSAVSAGSNPQSFYTMKWLMILLEKKTVC